MRILTLFILIVLSALIGGLYGALYDQLTFTISPEFFTKFRFGRFDLDPDMDERMAAAVIGFLNTWKAGMVLGGILALASWVNSDSKLMFKYTMQAFGITLLIAFVTAMIGWSIGPLDQQPNPDAELGIIDMNAFKTVINMNNFSYAGGVIGMFVGIFHQLYSHKRHKVKQMVINQESL